MKLKQLLSVSGTAPSMIAIILLTGAAVNKAIPLWQFLVWVVIFGTVLQISVNSLDKHFKNGEWVRKEGR